MTEALPQIHPEMQIVRIEGAKTKYAVRSTVRHVWPDSPDDFDTPAECAAWIKGWLHRDGEDRDEAADEGDASSAAQIAASLAALFLTFGLAFAVAGSTWYWHYFGCVLLGLALFSTIASIDYIVNSDRRTRS